MTSSRGAGGSTISAVCFDVAGVLTQPAGDMFLRRASAAGLDMASVQHAMWASFAAAGDDEPAQRLERGEITLEDFFGLLGEFEPIARVLMHPDSPHFIPGAFEPHAGMHALVRDVQAAGYRTAIVSNVVDEWLPAWDGVCPPMESFDVVVHSCVVGHRKPGAAIYEEVLRRLDVPPGEVLYLDDFPAMTEAAGALGIQTVLVDDHDRAIAEVRERLGLAPGRVLAVS